MAERLRVVVIDSCPIFRVGVVEALRRSKTCIVVAEGSTIEDAERFVRVKAPDVLILESAVPGSLKAVQAIMQKCKNISVIFLASKEDPEHVTQALQAGVQGYVMKRITGPEFVKVVKAIHAGERYLSPDLAYRLIARPEPAVEKKARLSNREQQVLDHTFKGLTNQEIAGVLGLTVSTIKYYKTLAFRKMGVRNRLEAKIAMRAFAKET